jgi:hypothetical protein
MYFGCFLAKKRETVRFYHCHIPDVLIVYFSNEGDFSLDNISSQTKHYGACSHRSLCRRSSSTREACHTPADRIGSNHNFCDYKWYGFILEQAFVDYLSIWVISRPRKGPKILSTWFTCRLNKRLDHIFHMLLLDRAFDT